MGRLIDYLKKKQNCIKYWKDKGVKIKDGTFIETSVLFGSEPYLVSIGRNCKITSCVEFITHDGGIHVLRNLDENLQKFDLFKGYTFVGDNVFIGNRSIIMPGVTIGDNVIIGAGSIVTKNIPSNSVVAGIPAKIICSTEEYKNKNKKYFLETKFMNYKEKKNFILKEYDKEKQN